jgi:hypothetical protein
LSHALNEKRQNLGILIDELILILKRENEEKHQKGIIDNQSRLFIIQKHFTADKELQDLKKTISEKKFKYHHEM